nr:putative pentatricopeptide repeat-containing protein At1g12700, mitochondrial [Tanacetum cinerariifolium]
MVANAPPYNALINGYCLIGRVDEGKKLFNIMICDRDAINYSVLINGYCKKDVIDKTVGLMDEMRRLKIDPDVCYWGYTDAVSAVSCAPQARVEGDRKNY